MPLNLPESDGQKQSYTALHQLLEDVAHEYKLARPFKSMALAEREEYLAQQQTLTFRAIFQRESKEGETSQINRCRDFLNSGSHKYDLDTDDTAVLISLVERFLVEKSRLLTRYGYEQEEASGGKWDGMIPAEVNKQSPPHELFTTWVQAEQGLRGNASIVDHAQDILDSIREFMVMRGQELRS